MTESLILLVEDDEADILLARRAMAKAELRNPIEVIRNGEDALDYLLNQEAYADPSRFPKPGVVLLDLNLPGLDGRDLLKRMQEEPTLQAIPVIVVSTSDDEKDIEFCSRLGVRQYIVKPIRASSLTAALAGLFGVEVALAGAAK
jgi:CheY-like chemotaxis protein